MRPWSTVATQSILSTPWFSLRSDRCTTADGRLIDPYYVMETRDWVHVVALTPAGQILLVRQYRHAVGHLVDELPGGIRDAGEDPLETARRELREETGAVSDKWIQISSVYPDPARLNNRVWGFLALDIRFEHATHFDENEEIEARCVDFETVHSLIAAGEFTQSTQIASYYMARHHLQSPIVGPTSEG